MLIVIVKLRMQWFVRGSVWEKGRLSILLYGMKILQAVDFLGF